MVDGSDVPGLDIHCMGWRLEDVELSQYRAVIRLESRTGGGRQEGVFVLPVRPSQECDQIGEWEWWLTDRG